VAIAELKESIRECHDAAEQGDAKATENMKIYREQWSDDLIPKIV
jgi:hypothetical protein